MTEWEEEIMQKFCDDCVNADELEIRCTRILNPPELCMHARTAMELCQQEIKKVVAEVQVDCMRVTLGDNKAEVLSKRGIE